MELPAGDATTSKSRSPSLFPTPSVSFEDADTELDELDDSDDQVDIDLVNIAKQLNMHPSIEVQYTI